MLAWREPIPIEFRCPGTAPYVGPPLTGDDVVGPYGPSAPGPGLPDVRPYGDEGCIAAAAYGCCGATPCGLAASGMDAVVNSIGLPAGPDPCVCVWRGESAREGLALPTIRPVDPPGGPLVGTLVRPPSGPAELCFRCLEVCRASAAGEGGSIVPEAAVPPMAGIADARCCRGLGLAPSRGRCTVP